MKPFYLAWVTLTRSAAAFTGQAQTTTGGVRISTAGAPGASAVLDLRYGLDFYTSAVNRLSITGDGNVGLGTSAPSQLLELGGQNAPTLLLHSTSNNLVNGAMLQFRESDLGYGWHLRHNSGGSTNDRLVLESTNNGPVAKVMSWE